MMTLGLSRNNPGNLLPEHISWFGLSAHQPDEGPLAFETLSDGIRAFVRLCYTYQLRGKNTPLTFITDYAPASENPTAVYIQNVCDWCGFQFDQTLNFHDTPTMIAWAKAIFRQEQGADNGITDEQVNQGIAMAEGHE